MSEATQSYIDLETSTTPINPGFQSTLDYIREVCPIRTTKRRAFRAIDAHISQLKIPTTNNNSPKSISIKIGRNSANRLRCKRYRHRPRCKRTPRRILCHPVQMLRRRYTDFKARPRLIHLRFRKRTLHVTTDRRYRRRMGTQRTQNH